MKEAGSKFCGSWVSPLNICSCGEVDRRQCGSCGCSKTSPLSTGSVAEFLVPRFSMFPSPTIAGSSCLTQNSAERVNYREGDTERSARPLPLCNRSRCQVFVPRRKTVWTLQLHTRQRQREVKASRMRRFSAESCEVVQRSIKTLNIQHVFSFNKANKELLAKNKLFIHLHVSLKSFTFTLKILMWSLSFEKIPYEGLVCLRHERH